MLPKLAFTPKVTLNPPSAKVSSFVAGMAAANGVLHVSGAYVAAIDWTPLSAFGSEIVMTHEEGFAPAWSAETVNFAPPPAAMVPEAGATWHHDCDEVAVHVDDPIPELLRVTGIVCIEPPTTSPNATDAELAVR
jgi:hypothetical protein